MRLLWVLFRKEVKQYFLTPFGWSIIIFNLLMQGFFLSTALKRYQDFPTTLNLFEIQLRSPLFWFFFLFLIPLLTMRVFAEEKKTGTFESLVTLPIQLWQIVLGKFLASWLFFLLLWSFMLWQIYAFEVIVEMPAPIEWGQAISFYLMFAIVGAGLIAVGCWTSAMSKNQIIAGIMCIFLLISYFFFGYIPKIWGEKIIAAQWIYKISLQNNIGLSGQGYLHLGSMIFYLSGAIFMLVLTHVSLTIQRIKQ